MSFSLPAEASHDQRTEHYALVMRSIDSLLEDENDWVAAMATVACELHHAFAYFHWTGFYRVTTPGLLVIGPYQGGHGCLRIPFGRGVCGAAAKTQQTQRIADVAAFDGHIACSSSTRSELVVPLVGAGGHTLAVLDVDSDLAGAFSSADQTGLESLCAVLARRYAVG